MRRFCLLLTCLALAGCTSTGSRNPDGKPTSQQNIRNSDRDRGPAQAPFWADPNDRSAPPPTGTTGRNNRIPPTNLPTRNDGETLLAGAVVDPDGQRIPDAFVQILARQGSKTGKAKPIGVHTDGQGYFTVPVRPGEDYELSARVDERNRTLGGSMIVQAPDTQIILKVSEGGVSSITPSAPPAIGNTGPFAPKSKDSTWQDMTPPAAQFGSPKKPPITSSHPENIAADPSHVTLPAANIPGPNSSPAPSVPAPSTTPNLPPLVPPEDPEKISTPVPKNNSKRSFELMDLQGKSWRFGDHAGKLVLLDFWGTWCGPCMRAIPEVKNLAKQYGTSGLEVLGVACERDGSWDQQANNVAKVAQRQEINYALYLEPPGKFGQVQDKFGIKSYPTLILLDREGKVLYRGNDFVQLERIIKANIR
ncbi:redoxin domain-containing protein [Telmatocola sphagniphila]|uniref:Redoxin domain-containing protein n=1 Tax=Telmatocola sphagniphila TaxID=1123043 RepID=A0A8E6B407_9BACT|nr:redoxin domain-containing protein [Telmatocola sphagniphila]QVL30894.1 redoxin domain-containing protein [Telmatocola sphagniphila]